MLCVVALFFTSLLSVGCTQSSGWRQVAETKDNKIFIDEGNVSRVNSEEITVRIKHVPLDIEKVRKELLAMSQGTEKPNLEGIQDFDGINDKEAGRFSYSVYDITYDCAGKWQFNQFTSFDVENKRIAGFKFSQPDWNEASPSWNALGSKDVINRLGELCRN